MPTVDFLPIATAGGANVRSQVSYAGSIQQTNGNGSGIEPSDLINKMLRQPSFIAAALATYVSNVLGVSVLDDGNLAGFITKLTQALSGGGALVTAFSATPTFDFSAVNTREITLTGNVTSSSITGQFPGQVVKFIIHQDATGGRTFVAPASVPMGVVNNVALSTSVQSFLVGTDGTMYAYTPMGD